MSKQFIPSQSNKKFIQNNRTDIHPLANLWASYNLDFTSNVGVMRLSPRLRINTSSSSDADLGVPVAFKNFNSKNWAICGTRVFSSNGNEPDDTFLEDALTGFQTDYDPDESDMELFNGTLCATTTDGLYSCNGSAWTSRDTLSSGSPHILAYFKKYDRLYYSNAYDNIISIANDWTTADPSSDYAISLSTDSNAYFITSMKASNTFMWIGILNQSNKGMGGKILRWDGISPAIQDEFLLGNAQGCMAITIDPKTDTPVAMGSDGILYGFNGSGFQEIGRLPFADKLPYNIGDADNERFIHPNGMFFTKNGTLLALINNRRTNSSETVLENMSSGIWEFNKDVGFTHRYSFTYNELGSSTVTDFGQNRVARVGAIASLQVPSNASVDGTLVAGVQYYTNASSTATAIFTDNSLDTIKKSGYFVSTWFESLDIEENWKRLWEVHRRFLNSTDFMVFKYRLEEEAPLIADITWVDTTHFTTTTDITAYDPSASGFDGTYGGEVEILRGTGGGSCRHITSIVNNSGTYTVTIDSVVTGVSTGTATARFQKWIKLLPEVSGQVNSYTGMPVMKNSPRIQFKGYMEWTGVNELKKIAIYSTEFLDVQE